MITPDNYKAKLYEVIAMSDDLKIGVGDLLTFLLVVLTGKVLFL